MRQHNRIPVATQQKICGRAEAANAAAETLRRMEAQMSSLKCDLAGGCSGPMGERRRVRCCGISWE